MPRKTKSLRTASCVRKTSETNSALSFTLDGTGKNSIATSLPFFDHMLALFAKNCACDCTLKATGDTEIDSHHLMEDVGIVMGTALNKALGDKRGIIRYGFASIPMDDSLVDVSIDISGRPCCVFNMHSSDGEKERYELFEHFFQSLVTHAGIALHVNLRYGKNFHHNMEAAFKALGRALRMAAAKDPRIKGIPSTKGKL